MMMHFLELDDDILFLIVSDHLHVLDIIDFSHLCRRTYHLLSSNQSFTIWIRALKRLEKIQPLACPMGLDLDHLDWKVEVLRELFHRTVKVHAGLWKVANKVLSPSSTLKLKHGYARSGRMLNVIPGTYCITFFCSLDNDWSELVCVDVRTGKDFGSVLVKSDALCPEWICSSFGRYFLVCTISQLAGTRNAFGVLELLYRPDGRLTLSFCPSSISEQYISDPSVAADDNIVVIGGWDGNARVALAAENLKTGNITTFDVKMKFNSSNSRINLRLYMKQLQIRIQEPAGGGGRYRLYTIDSNLLPYQDTSNISSSKSSSSYHITLVDENIIVTAIDMGYGQHDIGEDDTVSRLFFYPNNSNLSESNSDYIMHMSFYECPFRLRNFDINAPIAEGKFNVGQDFKLGRMNLRRRATLVHYWSATQNVEDRLTMEVEGLWMLIHLNARERNIDAMKFGLKVEANRDIVCDESLGYIASFSKNGIDVFWLI